MNGAWISRLTLMRSVAPAVHSADSWGLNDKTEEPDRQPWESSAIWLVGGPLSFCGLQVRHQFIELAA